MTWALPGFGTTMPCLPARVTTLSEMEREVHSHPKPDYLILARRLNLSGPVNTELVIASDGKVKNTPIIGRHLLLVQAAQRAPQLRVRRKVT